MTERSDTTNHQSTIINQQSISGLSGLGILFSFVGLKPDTYNQQIPLRQGALPVSVKKTQPDDCQTQTARADCCPYQRSSGSMDGPDGRSIDPVIRTG